MRTALLIPCLLALGAAPELDGDGDGFVGALDCDDVDPATYPGAVEVCDERDNDCDGVAEKKSEPPDLDGDGATICDPEPDCDDLDPAVSPQTDEVCDGADQDCDGLVDDHLDGDGDGVTPCGPDGVPGTADDDCDDTEWHVAPGRVDVCDGTDADCDGFIELQGGAWFCDPCFDGPAEACAASQGDDGTEDGPADDGGGEAQGAGDDDSAAEGGDDAGAGGAAPAVGLPGAPRWAEAGHALSRPRPTAVAPAGCALGPSGAWLGLLLLRRRR